MLFRSSFVLSRKLSVRKINEETPIKVFKHYEESWDKLNKSINEMKEKINERLSSESSRKSNRRIKEQKPKWVINTKRKNSAKEIQFQPVKILRRNMQSPLFQQPLEGNKKENKSRKRSSSRKRRCENCFKLLSKGFSTVDCLCHKAE